MIRHSNFYLFKKFLVSYKFEKNLDLN
jgi:hypothetical protein